MTALWLKVPLTGFTLTSKQAHTLTTRIKFQGKLENALFLFFVTHLFNATCISPREQAIQLLRKFYMYDIITRVDGKENYDAEFEDNKDLYRLCSSALEKLPIVKPASEQLTYPEKVASFNPGLTEKSLALHNSLTSGPFRRPNAANSVKSSRTLHRTFSNTSSLLSCQTLRTNGCVNRAFRDSSSNERTPFKVLQPRPSMNLSKLSDEVTHKSLRPRTPTNVFWL